MVHIAETRNQIAITDPLCRRLLQPHSQEALRVVLYVCACFDHAVGYAVILPAFPRPRRQLRLHVRVTNCQRHGDVARASAQERGRSCRCRRCRHLR